MSTSSQTKLAIECFAAHQPRDALKPFHYEPKPLGPWDIEVDITHCGICHSDLHLIDNDWNFSVYPLVPGHEIVGIVKKKGPYVQLEVGERVGIGWQRSSCQVCDYCEMGEKNLCSKQEATCVGNFGGFAKSIVSDSRFAFKIPKSMASEHAAPLLCGGITVFSPLLQHQANPNMRIGVVGIGGLGHLALQFARAFGCEVFALSSTAEKEQEAYEFGANKFIVTKDKQGLQKINDSLDLVLCTSSGNLDWKALFNTLRPKGKLILIGAPKGGQVALEIMPFIAARKGIFGSNIGSPAEIRKMLACADHHKITPTVEVFPLNDVNKALEKLKQNQVKYRAVLKN